MAIVIKNGVLVTMNPNRDIIKADVVIAGDRIQNLTASAAVNEGDVVIDARNKLVIPGLIQTHVHLCQTLFRGMADDLELLDWLNKRIWPLESAHDEESLYYSALLGCGELLRGGTTAVIDMGTVNHTDSVFHAAAQSGIRYLGGKCMMDHGKGDKILEKTEESLNESVRLLEKWDGFGAGRIRYAFCPRFVPSCSSALLKEVGILAEKYGTPVHTHASENQAEIRLVESERGRRNIQYLEDMGLCNRRLVLAHCIHVDDAEKQVLRANRVNVVHCPSSNLKLASGVAPIPEYLQREINVTLGADGPPCNNNLSMFTEMRLAALIHKPYHGAMAMRAKEVFEMATINGAKAMGRQADIGSIEVGKKADLALVDINRWHNWPTSQSDVYAQLVYQLYAHDVSCTIVDGRICMLEDRMLTLDQDEVFTHAEKALQRIASKVGLKE